MKGSTSIRKVLALCMLAATLALPVSGQAHDRYRSSGSVTFGYGEYYGYPDRHYVPMRRGYGPRHHGYYVPRYPMPYYRPYSRIYYEPYYYAPRYYGYGGSGWDIDLRYHFSDRW